MDQTLFATGIDVGEHSIKIAQMRFSGGQYRLLKTAHAVIDPYPDENSDEKNEHIGRLIRNLLLKEGIRHGDNIASIPSKGVIVRYSHLPPAPSWKLKMLMKYELEEYVHGSVNDIAYDFRLIDLPTRASEFTVMIAMAKNNTVEQRVNILSKAGIKKADMTYNSLCLYNVFRSGFKDPEDQRMTLLLDIGHENTELAIQQGGRLYFVRSIAFGGHNFTSAISKRLGITEEEAENMKIERGITEAGTDAEGRHPSMIQQRGLDIVMEQAEKAKEEKTEVKFLPKIEMYDEAVNSTANDFINLVRSTILYAKAQTKLVTLNIDEIHITGGCSNLKGLKDILAKKFQLKVDYLDAFAGLNVSRDVGAGERHIYTTAIGLALAKVMDTSFNLDLQLSRIKSRKEYINRDVFLWASVVLFAATVILIIANSWIKVSRFEGHKKELLEYENLIKTEKTSYDKMMNEYDQLNKRISVLKGRIFSAENVLTLLSILKKEKLDNMWLTDFKSEIRVGSDMTSNSLNFIYLQGISESKKSMKDAQALVRTYADNLQNKYGYIFKESCIESAAPVENRNSSVFQARFSLKVILQESSSGKPEK